jgi:ADP-dependent NAD(P)H-hydrate dehydratase / NAD(P)H-hydrate epimerase
VKLVTVPEMQAVEREADAGGFSYAEMMENAGAGLAKAVVAVYGERREGGVLGLVGSGNNGGDTLVALERLADWGWQARAYLVRPRPKDDPLVARLTQVGGEISTIEGDPDLELLEAWVKNHAVLLDGVLGTGIQLPLRGRVADALARVKEVVKGLQISPPVVVAVDCPSGVDCDTGEAAAETIPANLTVTMAAVKTGLLRFPAARLAGEIRVTGIGLETSGLTLNSWEGLHREVATAETVRANLPERPPDSHKGTFGTVLVVAGSLNYTGAALLAGQAAYRSGAGLVTLAVPSVLHAPLAGQFPEATWLLLPHEMGVIAEGGAEVIHKNLERATCLLVGPGFGLEEKTSNFLSRLIGANRGTWRGGIGFVSARPSIAAIEGRPLPPMVIDADGLKLLARIEGWHSYLPAPAVLTPHPGEMGILAGMETSEIQADRLGTAERFAREWGHVVVLKGANTVVSGPDGRTTVIPIATAALARAGTGDVLAGLIAGLRAQGVEAFDAAVTGCWIHAQAGLEAEKQLGSSAAVLAGDVLRGVPQVLKRLYSK